MKDFGIWYFQIGWMITALIGIGVGKTSVDLNKPWLCRAYIALMITVGVAAFYFKYYTD